MIFILRGFVIIMNMIKHAAELEAVYTHAVGGNAQLIVTRFTSLLFIKNQWMAMFARPSPPSIQLSVGGRVSC